MLETVDIACMVNILAKQVHITSHHIISHHIISHHSLSYRITGSRRCPAHRPRHSKTTPAPDSSGDPTRLQEHFLGHHEHRSGSLGHESIHGTSPLTLPLTPPPLPPSTPPPLPLTPPRLIPPLRLPPSLPHPLPPPREKNFSAV